MIQFIEKEIFKINNLDYYKNIKAGNIILKNNKAKDDIMIIHGGNSAPIIWLSVGIKFYINNYNIYLYSIPGFSSPIDINLLQSNNNVLLDYYNENIKTFIIKNKIKPNLIGHSFGGFLAINFSLKYPDLISSLIPINSLGILYLQNNNILLYTLLYKSIQYILKKLYPLFTIISFILLYFLNRIKLKKKKYFNILSTIYYILNISRPDYYGTNIIYKFLIIESSSKVYWNKLLFNDMITKKLPPISFIWSKKDELLSYYIPILFIYLLKIYKIKYPSLILLTNNSHGFTIKDANLLYNNIINAINRSKKIKRSKKIEINKIKNNN